MSEGGQEPRPVLVIGASGCLGRCVRSLLAARGVPATASSRDPGAPVYVDLLASPVTWRLPEPSGAAALLLAARTDTAACEKDPEGARRINVDATMALARRLAALGFFLVFPSTSQVFDGKRAWPEPGDTPTPLTVYGRHKAEVEAMLLEEFPTRAAIVRISKVLDKTNGLVRRWTASLLRGEPVHAFDDMLLAPVNEVEAAAALLDAADSPGIRHLSAARDLSYYEMARLGAGALGVDASLVQAASCAGRGLFAPAHTALGMSDPAPEPAAAVLRAFTLAKAEAAA